MSREPLSRRRFLVGGALTTAAGLAGCLDAVGGNDTERGLELALSRAGESLREGFVVDLSASRSGVDEAAFEAALDGEAYTTRYRKPFFSTPADPKYAERDGTYYRLGSVVVDEASATRPVLRLSAVGEPTDTAAPDAVPASELPEADRIAVRIAQMAARARGNDGGVPWGVVQRGGYVYRNEEAVTAATLPTEEGPDRVRYRDRVYAVEVSRERFYEPVYRPTVERVATSPERMEAILRAKFVGARLRRGALSTAAREIVEAARTDGHRETHPYSDGYREVLRGLHERAYIDGNIRKDAGVDDDGRRMVRYGDVYYDYRLRFVSTGN